MSDGIALDSLVSAKTALETASCESSPCESSQWLPETVFSSKNNLLSDNSPLNFLISLNVPAHRLHARTDREFGLYSCLVLFFFILVSFFPVPSQAQNWDTAVNHPGSPRHFLPPYPLAFVAAKKQEEPNSSGNGVTGKNRYGLDVLDANAPKQENHLWILLPSGTVMKLFPLSAHTEVPGLIDTPNGELFRGAVVEPNISENGRYLYFSYFHDVTHTDSQTRQVLSGADLYRMDLGPLLDGTTTEPATLSVIRLTTRQLTPSGAQELEDRHKDAQNFGAAAGLHLNNWGTAYLHGEEMRTDDGLHLVYVSDGRRLGNSNNSMNGYTNHNFNMHIADIQEDGTLSNHRQLLHYTTTSVLSPARLRNGLAFSYQATTEDARHWEIQQIDSEGKWSPLIGFGMNPSALHLGSFCVKTTGADPGDYFVSTRYYNLNNLGFGSLWSSNLSTTGLNEYDTQSSIVRIPTQVGAEQISLGIPNNDDPSPKINGAYIGKASTPRCGRPNELFFSYTFTSANGRLFDAEGNKHMYEPFIGMRPNLEGFNPLAAAHYEQKTGIIKVIEDTSKQYALMWPTPVLSWEERTGDEVQQFSPRVASQKGGGSAGLPLATVGTSALYNTDRKPFDCHLGFTLDGAPYSPNSSFLNLHHENDKLYGNQDGLTVVQNAENFCEDLTPDAVFGVAIQMTSNRLDLYDPDYVVGEDKSNGSKSSKRRETARLLGVIDVRNQSDTSFKAHIPSDVPFEFHLLDKRTGLKLTDVRSWHSLRAQEVRTDCGGCHNHKPGGAIPFEGTAASASTPTDVFSKTPYIEYDAECDPTLQLSETPAVELPEWTSDIWPKFNEYCSTCHSSLASSDHDALAALSYTDERSAYNALLGRKFVHHQSGALGSAAFWAARGQRTDGRDNTLPQYQPDYENEQFGYRFSDVHRQQLNLCDGSQPDAAKWVYRFGLWIDNHAPRDAGAQYPTKFDRYHPTVSASLEGPSCEESSLRIGAWDDSGTLALIEVYQDGALLTSLTDVPNGVQTVTLASTTTHSALKIYAYDEAGNKQEDITTLIKLRKDCEAISTNTPPPGGGSSGGGSSGDPGGTSGGGTQSEISLTASPAFQRVAPGSKLRLTVEANPEPATSLRVQLECVVRNEPELTEILSERLAHRVFELDPILHLQAQVPARRNYLTGQTLECRFRSGEANEAIESNQITIEIKDNTRRKKRRRYLTRYRKARSRVKTFQTRCNKQGRQCKKYSRLKESFVLGRKLFRS